ncbi:hypothetical protein AAKU52_002656 [Pedobacter sp. CG_S7]|uniref:baeRF3 domain-containing protein n=1 Tax=Pedobacter sp. CG_S7 TaxID=3143930 RepID=UPI0033936E0A
MNTNLSPEIKEVIAALHYRPAVSILMPLEAKISLKTELNHALKIASDKVERALLNDFPNEICEQIMQRLAELIKEIDFDTTKKSIAIYVSLVFQKVYYLDVPVEEKIIVDESFEIRDLIYSKKQQHSFLLLFLSGKQSRMFLTDFKTLTRLKANIPEDLTEYEESPGEIVNFSDMTNYKQTMVDNFLLQMDKELHTVLHDHPLPVIVLGNEKILGHFKKSSENVKSIIAYVDGSYDNATIPQLKELLQPYLDAWETDNDKEVLNQLDAAAGKNQLAIGIKEVWKEAMNQPGKLLVVEKNFKYPAQRGSSPEAIEELVEPYNQFSYIRDAVDDVIEKILLNGGDVEFTAPEVLKEYSHIALIKYF